MRKQVSRLTRMRFRPAVTIDPNPANPVNYSSLAIPACRRGAYCSLFKKSFLGLSVLRRGVSARASLIFGARRACRSGGYMYAVLRTGGKQYRVAPGDVVKIETVSPSQDQTIEFSDVLAVSGDNGILKPSSAKVTAEVVGEGRGDKILVFHLKRKKQYKKMQGHRQNFTEVRIKAIEADGVTYTAEK